MNKPFGTFVCGALVAADGSSPITAGFAAAHPGLTMPATPVASVYPLAFPTRPVDALDTVWVACIQGATPGTVDVDQTTDVLASAATRNAAGAAADRSFYVGCFRKNEVALGSPEEGNLLAACRVDIPDLEIPVATLTGKSFGIVSVARTALGVYTVTTSNPIEAGSHLAFAQPYASARAARILKSVTPGATQSEFTVRMALSDGSAGVDHGFDFWLLRLRIGLPVPTP